jgi:hypothetical protein
MQGYSLTLAIRCLYCRIPGTKRDTYRGILSKTAQKFTIKHEYYNLKSVNDIIFNMNSRVVSIFKDYLIMDDICDFIETQYKFGLKTNNPSSLKFGIEQAKVTNNVVF